MRRTKITKRCIDFSLSLVLLVLLLLPMCFLYLILALYFRGNPIYASIRAGIHGKPFVIYKFKTMREVYDEDNCLLPDNERITKFGNIIRGLSLDELPQLLNVLKGNMSLIGPRPLTVEYIPLYSKAQRKRLDVKPGISGLAQVNGRNSITWNEKFRLDVQYVENQSLKLDIKILFLTVYKVLIHEGVKQDGFINSERFTGNNTR
ncbi:sugar transferase [Listeria grandensis]|uniref:Sugar transferase n=1 Tax=Listeria grandensis TaxID=1494963 RepID=A0A7X0Y348_9LIST|nr:sugar transferase [Listeria grandensis]MBC1936150.1 sugar transferase [Listeria grandensis]